MKIKPKVAWISMEDLTVPKNWALPFEVEHQGKKYKITGVDYIDRLWRAEEIE